MKVWLPAVRSGTGADVFTQRLHDALHARGVDAEVTWFPLSAELFPAQMRRMSPPPGVDLVHANGWAGCAFADRGIPLVVTVHHLVHDAAYAPFCSVPQAIYHRLHLRGRDLRAIRRADAVTAVSGYVAGTVEAFSGRRGIRTIHNWIDASTYRPGSAPRRPGPQRLLLVGNGGRRKGEDLLPALVDALGAGFDVRCTGGLRDGVGAGIAGITWLGRLDEAALIREYQDCDAVLSLSRYEGFGYTAVEGMACGKPFLGFRTSGLAEVVSVDAGRLVSLEDVAALANEARRLRDAPGEALRMGAAGRHHVLAHFGEQKVDGYLRLYEELVAARGAAA
ncbi:MAG TPA: glycosyltransferase family 4 protein [Lysobacter sp.]